MATASFSEGSGAGRHEHASGGKVTCDADASSPDSYERIAGLGVDRTHDLSGVVIGVAVTAFNQQHFIEQCLRSVATQEGVRFRCVVVDDGSTDSTAEVVRAFCDNDGRFSSIRQTNSGVARARNAAIAALGDTVTHVCVLDGDDRLRPDALRRLADAAAGLVGAHGLADFIDEAGDPFNVGVFSAAGRRRWSGRRGWPHPLDPSAPSTFESVLIGTTVFPSGVVLARRDAYERVGGFDQRLFPAEDIAVVLELCRLGDLAFVDDVVIDYRRHSENMSGRSDAPLAAHRVLVLQHVRPDNSHADMRRSRRAYRARQVLDAAETCRRCGQALRRGRVDLVISQLIRLPLRLGRWVRGRPSGREVTEARRWAAQVGGADQSWLV